MKAFSKYLLWALLVLNATMLCGQNNLIPTNISNFNIGAVGNDLPANNLANAGVYTDYVYVMGDNSLKPDEAVQHYAVGNNARHYNHASNWLGETGFFEMGDHTTGSGNYMIVNGATQPNKKVWEYTVTGLIPGVIYTFEAYVTCLFMNPTSYLVDPYRPKLLLRINNQNVGSEYQIPWVNGGQWVWWHNLNWTANSTTATITIVNNCTQDNGNDFGIDDISFKMINGYTVSASSFTETLCYCQNPGQGYFVIDLSSHYTCNTPAGPANPELEIQKLDGTWVSPSPNWWIPGERIPTAHGSVAFSAPGGVLQLYYYPASGYLGTEQIHYRIKKFGMTSSSATANLTIGDIPSNPVPNMSSATPGPGTDGDYYLCVGNVSSFNPSATWTPNGSQVSSSGWEWGNSANGPWQSGAIPNTVGDRYVRFYANNDCSFVCGNAGLSVPVLVHVCNTPVLNKTNITPPGTICQGGSLPESFTGQVWVSNWNNDDDVTGNGVAGWWIKPNGGSWVPMTPQTVLQNGDRVKFRAENSCDFVETNDVAVTVTTGPAFTQNTPSFSPQYCVGDPLMLSTITPPNHTNPGSTVTDEYWAWSLDGSTGWTRINGNPTLSLDWDGRYICYLLECSCGGNNGMVPSPNPYQLTVYGPPTIVVPDPLPVVLDTFCPGPVSWSAVLPDGFYPEEGSYYINEGWEISANSNQGSAYSSNFPSQLLPTDNGRWIRYFVDGCGDPVHSPSIQLFVGDKPSLNTNSIILPSVICSGTSVSSLVEQGLITDVQVTGWNLFDDPEEIFERWEVNLNGTWTPFTVFELIHNGCQIRYHAHNECGEEYAIASTPANVTEGPSFTSPNQPLNFPSYFCDGQPISYPTEPSHNDHGITVVGYWAYDDGSGYQEIPYGQILNESWHGYQVTYILNSDCGGEIVYPTPFTLTVVGEPEVEISIATSGMLCVGPLSLDTTVNWHHGTPSPSSSWQYAPNVQPYVFTDFDPNIGILEAGNFVINYHAVTEECGFDGYAPNALSVTLNAGPEFEDPITPFELGRFCEGEVLTKPDDPVMTGYVENSRWQVSVSIDPAGNYVDYEPGYVLQLADDGKWLRFMASGCSVVILHEEQIHVDGKPQETYDIVSQICTGQSLTYSIHGSNGYPVTESEWRLNAASGQVIDPDTYTFEEVGTFSIYYRVGNDCGWSDWQGPETVEVVAGPSFDNSTIPSDPLPVCTGTTVATLLSDYGLNPPQVVNPETVAEELGWYFRYKDESNITHYLPVESTGIIEEGCHGFELCYAVRGDCSEVPVYSNGAILHVFGVPEIVSMPTLDLEFCDGDLVALPEDVVVDDHHGEGYVMGQWQVKPLNGSWGPLPERWSREQHQGASVRYHVENTYCNLTTDSPVYPVQVQGIPEITGNLPESVSVCAGESMGLMPPAVNWNDFQPEEGIWQVSPNPNSGFNSFDHYGFDPEHADSQMDGWYVRYHVEGCGHEDNSNPAKVTVLASAHISIAEQDTIFVAVMTSFWPGKYYFYPGEENINVDWLLIPDDLWPARRTEVNGRYCFEVCVTQPGRALLQAYLGDGHCGFDEVVLDATPFSVDEQQQMRLEIYPNPAQHSVTVASEAMESVRVYNLFGQLVKYFSCANKDRLDFSVEDMAAALYIVEVQNGKGVIRKQFSVSR